VRLLPHLDSAADHRAGVVVSPQKHRVVPIGVQAPSLRHYYVAVAINLVGGDYEGHRQAVFVLADARLAFRPFM